MSVLISGGTGFVGLNVAEHLLARGETVILYALDRPSPSTCAAFASLPGTLHLETGDIRDTGAFAQCLRRHRVDRLLPFAAITSGPVRESESPELVFEVNLQGFISQLRAARDAGVHRVIAPASGAVYGESFYGTKPVSETGTPCLPTSVYGVSKYAVERTALRLAALWDIDVIVARIGSLFGPWERDTGLRDLLTPFWQLTRAAQHGEAAVLPAEIQPYTWVYARDLAAGLVHLLDLAAPPPDKVFNICSGHNWDGAVLEWCRRLRQAYPAFTWRQSADPAEITVRFSETRPRTSMAIERIRATGWTPAFAPEAALADYLAWAQRQPA